MTIKEAREFLDNMAASEAAQMGLSDGFEADLHGYHCGTLRMAIRGLKAWEAVEMDVQKRICEVYADRSGCVLGSIINKHFSEVEGNDGKM